MQRIFLIFICLFHICSISPAGVNHTPQADREYFILGKIGEQDIEINLSLSDDGNRLKASGFYSYTNKNGLINLHGYVNSDGSFNLVESNMVDQNKIGELIGKWSSNGKLAGKHQSAVKDKKELTFSLKVKSETLDSHFPNAAEITNYKYKFKFLCPVGIQSNSDSLRPKSKKDTNLVYACFLTFEEKKGAFEKIAQEAGFYHPDDSPKKWSLSGRSSVPANEFKKGSVKAIYQFGNYGCHNEEGYQGLAENISAVITDGKRIFEIHSVESPEPCNTGFSPMQEEQLKMIIESFEFEP